MDGPSAPVPTKANVGIDVDDAVTSAHGNTASMNVTTASTDGADFAGTSRPLVPRSWPPPVPAHLHFHHRKHAIPLPRRSNEEEASPSLSSSSSPSSESFQAGGAPGGAKSAAAAAPISIETSTEFQKASYQTHDLVRHRHVIHPLPVSHHPTDQQGRMVRPSGDGQSYVSETPPPPPPSHLLHQANVLFGRDEQIQELEEIFEEVLGGGGGDGDGSALGVEVGGGSVGGGSNSCGSGKDNPLGSGSADGAIGTAKVHGDQQQQFVGATRYLGNNKSSSSHQQQQQPPQHGSSSNNRRHPQRRSYKSNRRPSASSTIMPTCTKQVVWIEGWPGTGKSALAMQTKEPCRRVGGFYLTGKFQQPFSFQQRHGDEGQPPQHHQQQQQPPSTQQAGEQRPYSALGDACMDLVDDLLLVYYNENESAPITLNDEKVVDRIAASSHHDVDGDDDEKDNEDDGSGKTKSDFSSNYHRWTMSRNELRQAFSENRQQLEILIPIIRNLPKLLEWEDYSSPRDGHLDGSITDDRDKNNSTTLLGTGIGQGGGCYVEAKQAVQYAFARFFVILGRFVPITVLVLDDWQWADDSSVDLVESLLLNESIHHLLMVNTIRTSPSSTPPASNSTNNNDSNDKSLSYFLDRWKLHIDNWMAAGPRAGAIAPNQSGATATTSSTSHTTMPPPAIPFKAHEISTENLTLDDLTCWLQTILYGDASSIGIGQNDGRHSTTREDTPEMRARDLAQCVHKRTVGNPLYVRQFLLSLLQQGLLTQVHDNNGRVSTWQFDVDTILGQAVACDNVVSFLSSQLLMMGEGGAVTGQSKDSRRSRQQQYLTRILPKLAALGTTFSFRVFEIVANDTIAGAGLEVEKLTSELSSQGISLNQKTSDAVAALLANLDSQGIFVVDRKRKLIRWVHDKLREAALTGLMVEEEVPRMKFELGRLLLEKLSEVEIKRELFLVTNLLNAGPPSMGDSRLLNQIILLNQQSGKIALMSSAFASASEYCAKGMRLLPELQRWTDPIYYPITLDLYSSAAEALFCTGNHGIVYELYDEMNIQKGIPLIDKRRICNAKLNSLAAQGRTVEAKVMTISVLSKLGCKFPRVGKSFFTIAGIIRALRTIDARTEKIATLKRVESAEVQWIAYLLDRLITCAYQCDADLLPLAILKGLRYTIDYGITDLAAPILATVGLLLATAPGDVNGGIKYAELALKYSNRQTLSRTLFIVNVFVLHFRLEYPKFNGPLLRGYEAGMESGDLESSCWCAYCYVELQLFTGKRLSTVLQECEKFYRNMEVLKQDFILWSMRMLYQLLLNLKNKPSDGHMLQGEIIADEKQLRQEIRDDSRHSVSWQVFLRLKLWLSFWFGEYQTVVDVMEEAGYDRCLVEKLNPGYFGTPVIYLQCAISCLSVYRQNRVKKYMKLAQKFLARLKDWVNKGNKNIQHGEALIQAEIATFGNQLEATKYYDVSNLLAGRWGIVNDQAFSHERLGNFLESIGQEEDAYLEYEKALELYSQWGARCRINRMLVLLKRTPGPVSTVDVGAEEVATTTVITDLSVI